MRKSYYGWIIFIGLLLLPANQGRPENDASLEQAFAFTLQESLTKLKTIRDRRQFRFRSVNDSINLTSEAIETLTESADYVKAEKLLRQAVQTHRDNVLAHLVLADVLDHTGQIQEAGKFYLSFFEEAEKASVLTQAVLSQRTRLIFAQYIEKKLSERGIATPQPKGVSQIPLQKQLAWQTDSPLRVLIATGLPILLLVSLPFLIFGNMMSEESHSAQNFLSFAGKTYLVLTGAYAIWLGHLFLNAPALIQPPELEVALFLLFGIGWVLCLHMRRKWKEQKRRLEDPTMRQCPSCKKPVQKLSAICPACNKTL